MYFVKVVLNLNNPKMYADAEAVNDSRLFPYYAGYGTTFTEQVIKSLNLADKAVILDPWNGSGTTTRSATRMGYRSIGHDLNPVMVLVAKSALLNNWSHEELAELAESIVRRSATLSVDQHGSDALHKWIVPSSAVHIRSIENELNKFVTDGEYQQLLDGDTLDNVSPLGAFFYLCLFRVTRKILAQFVASNPTWVKKPRTPNSRKRPSKELIARAFLAEVEILSKRLAGYETTLHQPSDSSIRLRNAQQLGLADRTIDAIITSPPYCTRIDYAVATSIELAVLRASPEQYDAIRRSLMGTSTVRTEPVAVNPLWGHTCNDFLTGLAKHPSKASSTYYFKNHVQYFNSLYQSISEIARVLRLDGKCVVVVQDSYYKEIRNDVPTILSEMASNVGLRLDEKREFPTSRSMAHINKNARKYLKARRTVESVLFFAVAED